MTSPEETERPRRNYVHEMRALIDAMATDIYIPAIVAHRIVDRLLRDDPELLRGWLEQQQVAFVRQAINDRDRSTRTQVRYQTVRSVFRDDADAAEQGDTERLRSWINVRYSKSDGTRIPLSEMTKEDLLDVSTQYRVRAESHALTAHFLSAIAAKIGAGRVIDHFTDEQLGLMWQSLTGL